MGAQQSAPAPPPAPAPVQQQEQSVASGKFCERIMFTDDDAKNVNTLDQFAANQSKLQSIQIQKVAERSYSSSTKLNLVPSIPFKFTFEGREIDVRRMTLYHPCPVRIENRQYDAVLSLNDPTDPAATHIMLIPLEGVSVGGGASANFFGKIASYIPGVLRQNTDGLFDTIDVPTGAGWDLSSLMETAPEGTQTVVKSPFFSWKGEPAYERYVKTDNQYEKVFSWRRSGAPTPTYIMLQNPSKIGSFDLQTILMLPVTPAEEAIHPIPKTFYYKTGPAAKGTPQGDACSSSKSKERFTNQSCDPFAVVAPKPLDKDRLVSIVLAIVSSLAIFIGVYFALKYATGPMGNVLKMVGEKIGRALARTRRAAAYVATEPKGPSLPEAVASIATEPKGPSLPEALQGIVKADTRKQGEDFAFKNPMIDLRRTQRILDAKKKAEKYTPVIDARRKTQRNTVVKPNPIGRKTVMTRLADAKKEAEAAGTGLLSPEQLKADPELRKFIKPFRRRVIAPEPDFLDSGRTKVEETAKKVAALQPNIQEAEDVLKRRRRRTANALLQEAKRRKTQ